MYKETCGAKRANNTSSLFYVAQESFMEAELYDFLGLFLLDRLKIF